MANELVGKVLDTVNNTWETVQPYAKKAVHIGFIPTIIVLGMTITEPRPSLFQLLGPM